MSQTRAYDELLNLCAQKNLRIEELEKENARLRVGINECLEHAGLHYMDWGERAEKAFDYLHASLANAEVSHDQNGEALHPKIT